MFSYTSFQIAKRHLVARRRQTLVAILGVTFGIAMYILMSGFMTGVNKIIDETQFIASPHIRIYKEFEMERTPLLKEADYVNNAEYKIHHQRPKEEDLYIKNSSAILQSLRKDPLVFGVSAQVGSAVFYNYGPLQLNGTLMGVDIREEDKLFSINKRLKSGKLESLLTVNNSIIMGEGLAKKLNVETGDMVSITTPKGIMFNLKVVGTFKFGLGTIDNYKSYCSIKTVQTILQKEKDYITEIYIKLYDLGQAKPLASVYAKKYDYKTEDWETANAPFLSSNKIRNVMTYVVSITLLTVAGFGIYNIMSMTIQDKMKDIAILKATGFSGGDVTAVFMTQALIIGLLGALLGLVFGFILCFMLSKVPFDSGGFFSIDTMPMNFSITFYIIGILFGLITTLIAGYMPSRRASKVDPVVIFRG